MCLDVSLSLSVHTTDYNEAIRLNKPFLVVLMTFPPLPPSSSCLVAIANSTSIPKHGQGGYDANFEVRTQSSQKPEEPLIMISVGVFPRYVTNDAAGFWKKAQQWKPFRQRNASLDNCAPEFHCGEFGIAQQSSVVIWLVWGMIGI